MGYLNSAPESIVGRLIKGGSYGVSILKVLHWPNIFEECRLKYSKTYNDVKELLWYQESTVRARITQFQGVALRMRIPLAALILKTLVVISFSSATTGRRCLRVFDPVCTSGGRSHINRCHARNWIESQPYNFVSNQWGWHDKWNGWSLWLCEFNINFHSAPSI